MREHLPSPGPSETRDGAPPGQSRLGPVPAASRSLMARFVPPESENEFFGFFAFSGKFTAFVGPFLLGEITQWTGSQRWGVSTVLVMFVVGALIMVPLDEERGIERAGQ